MCLACTVTKRFYAKNYCYRCDTSEAPLVSVEDEMASCTACGNHTIDDQERCVPKQSI